LFGCGTLFVLYTVLIYLAVGLARDRAQLLEIALLNYLWPALTILCSLVLLRRRASLLLVPGTIVALTGVFLVMTQGASVSWGSFVGHLHTNPVAYGLAAGAALAWALYSNLARLWSAPHSPGAVELFIPVTGLIMLGLRLCVTESPQWHLQAIFEAGALGGITALAYALWDTAMRKGDLLLVAACAYFTPLLSTVVSCAYLGVAPGASLWIGCALIVIGSLVSWRSAAPAGRALEP
jgi:drug/metabolite transporter (DMT)-like permease